MSITLGRAPQKLKVTVSPGGSFVSSIRRATGNWADGTSLVLDFGSIEWSADMDADVALWAKTAAEVDEMLAAKPKAVQLWFVDENGAGSRTLWASGSVDKRA